MLLFWMLEVWLLDSADYVLVPALTAPVLVTTASKFFGKKMALSSRPKEADASCYLGGDWKLANSSTPQIEGTQWNEVMQDGSWLLKSHLGFCKPRQWTSHTTCASIYQRTFNRLLMKFVSVLVCCQMDCQHWTFPNKDEADDISLVIIESHVYSILQVWGSLWWRSVVCLAVWFRQLLDVCQINLHSNVHFFCFPGWLTSLGWRAHSASPRNANVHMWC